MDFLKKKFDLLKRSSHLEIKLKSYPFLYKSKKKEIIKILKKKNVWDISLIDGDNLI